MVVGPLAVGILDVHMSDGGISVFRTLFRLRKFGRLGARF